MPSRPPRPCVECGALMYGDADCPDHPRSKRMVRDKRPSASVRGYGWDWKINVRDPYIKAHPWCTDPYGFHTGVEVRATLIDHIIPKMQGGTDEWSNLQSLCSKCHQTKRFRDGSVRGRGIQNYRDAEL